ncbi:hypothetical protein, partial [Fulvimarina endophytica]|uniref:hypothetical protein n=1 Tax=Fulvimarina endophytica TaxID=2293836 RepID=UPI001AED0EE9
MSLHLIVFQPLVLVCGNFGLYVFSSILRLTALVGSAYKPLIDGAGAAGEFFNSLWCRLRGFPGVPGRSGSLGVWTGGSDDFERTGLEAFVTFIYIGEAVRQSGSRRVGPDGFSIGWVRGFGPDLISGAGVS